VTAIEGGRYHSLALKANGTVVAWGDDTFGETDVPVGLSNVTAIATGAIHNLALKANAVRRSMGDPLQGRTGPISRTPRRTSALGD
jgi:alpha-tubulin suppressor-like RCC1 family protein